MSVRGELRARRLALAVAATLLVPAGLVAAALAYDPPPPPPSTTAGSYAPLGQRQGERASEQRERNRVAQRVARTLTAPALVDPSRLDEPLSGPARAGALPTLVLAPGTSPTLADLERQVPQAFYRRGGALVVRAHLAVPATATLTIDATTPDVRLSSGPQAFVTVISRGRVRVVGAPGRQVSIASMDPATGRPDADDSDGRAYLQQIGGRMDLDHARLDHLGFGTGSTSGVAWRGVDGASNAPAETTGGTVRSSVFSHNRFGVYTAGADEMVFRGNTFADNDVYGFDPHDFSDRFVVTDNVARGNGKHGFIFSRGCDGNVMRDNLAEDNGGHGFMVDDGRSEAVSFAQARVDASDDNQVVGNTARGNAGSGVEVEGGTGNVVRANHLEGNDVGVRLKNAAVAVVRGNTVVDNTRYGVDVLASAGHVEVRGNTITGSWGGVAVGKAGAATLASNAIDDVSAPLVVSDDAVRRVGVVERASRFLRWNPVLVLWGWILGVPLLVVAGRLVTRVPRPRVRRRAVELPE